MSSLALARFNGRRLLQTQARTASVKRHLWCIWIRGAGWLHPTTANCQSCFLSKPQPLLASRLIWRGKKAGIVTTWSPCSSQALMLWKLWSLFLVTVFNCTFLGPRYYFILHFCVGMFYCVTHGVTAPKKHLLLFRGTHFHGLHLKVHYMKITIVLVWVNVRPEVASQPSYLFIFVHSFPLVLIHVISYFAHWWVRLWRCWLYFIQSIGRLCFKCLFIMCLFLSAF